MQYHVMQSVLEYLISNIVSTYFLIKSLKQHIYIWRKEFAGHWVERGLGGVSHLATLNRYF